MSEQQIELRKLEIGHEFPQSTFKLDADTVSAYLKAVSDSSYSYQDTNTVPPMAIAALAMSALIKDINLPSGTVHVSQEFLFSGIAGYNDTLTSQAIIVRNLSRSKFHMLDIILTVKSQENKTIITGKTSFILPQENK